MSASPAPSSAGSGSAVALEPALTRLRVRIQRARLSVLLRRHALLALALAIALEALALLDVVPQLVVIAAPLVLLVATVAFALRRRLSLAGVAQLLDERLRLFDRLGTALELERRGAGNGGGTPLERRTVAEATTLVEGARGWRSRAERSPREWAAVGIGVAVLAALVAIAVVPGSSSDSGRGAEARAGGSGNGAGPGARHGPNKKALEQYIGAPNAPGDIKPGDVSPGDIRPGIHKRSPAAGKRKAGQDAYVTPSEGKPTHVQQGFEFKDKSLNAQREAGAQVGKTQAGGHTAKSGGAGAEKGGAGKTGAAGKEGGGPAGGGKSQSGKGASQNQSGSLNAAGTKPGEHANGTAPASKTPTGAKGESSKGPGTATPGQNTAGNGVGGNRTGKSQEIEGTKSKGGLKLQAGYAPYRAEKAGSSRGKTGEREGGGGKARTGAAEGGSSFGAGGGEFAFVPATGGAAADGGGSQLAQNYSAALGWLERLPW